MKRLNIKIEVPFKIWWKVDHCIKLLYSYSQIYLAPNVHSLQVFSFEPTKENISSRIKNKGSETSSAKKKTILYFILTCVTCLNMIPYISPKSSYIHITKRDYYKNVYFLKLRERERESKRDCNIVCA